MGWKIKFIFCLWVVTGPIRVSGQGPPNGLKGRLIDTVHRQALDHATLLLLRTDSSLYASRQSSRDGFFVWDMIPDGYYLLRISYTGYESRSFDIHLSGTLPFLDLGNIYMKVNAGLLASVVVHAPPIVMRGDTTELSAGYYTARPNAMLEDLLQKMPGFTIFKDGTVLAEGEAVKRILIDGRPYFGDNIRMSTKNIPSGLIEKVQVYDAKSEQSAFNGFNDGTAVKTLNIVTKENKRHGEFGKPAFGVGDGGRFSASVNVNSFQGKQRISVIGEANNVNQQFWSPDQVLSVMRNGGAGMFSGLSDAQLYGNLAGIGNQFGSPTGIINAAAAGLNYNNALGNKATVNGSYLYNRSAIRNSGQGTRTYFLPGDSMLVQKGENGSNSYSQNHTVNFDLEQKFDTATSVSIRPSFNSNDNHGASTNVSRTIGPSIDISSINTSSTHSTRDYSFQNSLLIRHRFVKKGRTISLNMTQEISRSNTDLRTLSLYEQLNTDHVSSLDTLHQRTVTLLTNKVIGAHLSYTEPLGQKAALELRYDGSAGKNTSGQVTKAFNNDTKQYDLSDVLQSNDYRSRIVSGSYSANVQLNINKRLNVIAGIGVQRTDLSGLVNEGAARTDQTFVNLLPNVAVQYRAGNNKTFRFTFRGVTTDPTVRQLQSITDYSNPSALYRGNPMLKQQLSYNANASYSYLNTSTFNSFKANINFVLAENKICNATLINSGTTPVLIDGSRVDPGIQYITPVNLQGAYKMTAFLNGNFNFGVRSKLFLSTWLANNLDLFLINNSAGKVYRTDITQTVKYTWNANERIDLIVAGNSGYHFAKYRSGNNPSADAPKGNYFSQVLSFGPTYSPAGGWIVASDLTYTRIIGQTESYNQSTALLNMKLSRLFGKSRQLEAGLSVNDLFNQNKNIVRNLQPTFAEETRTLVIQRYFLLSVCYHFSRF